MNMAWEYGVIKCCFNLLKMCMRTNVDHFQCPLQSSDWGIRIFHLKVSKTVQILSLPSVVWTAYLAAVIVNNRNTLGKSDEINKK